MLDRTNRGLLATAAVLLLLSGLRLWADSRPAEALWSIEPLVSARATAVQFSGPEGSVRIERADSAWQLVQPESRPADSEKVDGLLRDWVGGFAPDLKLLDAPSASELAEYGLDEASRLQLAIEGEGGALVELHLGKTVAGGSHFVRHPRGGAVFRGRVPGAHRLQFGLDAWRDKRLFPFAKDDLAGLTIEGSYGRFVFRRVETPDRAFWEGVEPEGFQPSSRALDAMGRSLANLKARRILEGEEAVEQRGEAGLNAPVLTATAETEGGRSYTLRFGAETDGDRWASLEGDSRLFALPSATYRVFDKDREALQDKTVVRFARSEGATITLRRGQEQVVVQAEGERGWALVPPAAPVAERELNLAANSLLNLQAAELLTSQPEGVPDFVVELPTEAGATTVAVYRQGQDRVATVSGRTGAFVLRGAVIERLEALLPSP